MACKKVPWVCFKATRVNTPIYVTPACSLRIFPCALSDFGMLIDYHLSWLLTEYR